MTLRRAVTQRLVRRALGAVTGGEVVVRYPDGRRWRFGDRPNPSVTVDVRRPEALWEKLAHRTRVGLGESYVDGDWDCSDLTALFTLLGRSIERSTDSGIALQALRFVQAHRPHVAERQTPRVARDNIRAHYDLGNELFRLMLDPTMTYSCAYWAGPEMTLEEAQRAKNDRVCEKLELGPSDHVLEIGCGWGSFALQAAERFGCQVTGLTLSPAQAALARERVRDAGLSDTVRIEVKDYRHLQGQFTRIVSIEMIEAIGAAEYDTYFSSIDRLLAPDGLVVVQAIGVPDDRFERYRRTPDWIQQYIFPGSLLPSVGALSKAVARTRLMIVDLEEIGIGYARTLSEWRANVTRHEGALRDLGYDDRFLRIWGYYLSYCEAGFALRVLRDVQLVLSRAGNPNLGSQPRARVSF